jgi:7,8-dihydropterin-6-yl-methyl-4-(beta-D-ribofuranosyl)aminobenzene 5'-phosphate synthase
VTISIKAALRHELDAVHAAYKLGHWPLVLHHLERAHVLGQRFFWAHLITHLWMLRVAWRRHDRREIVGQLARIMAVAPGYVFGWVPVGNTGGANVSPIKPMPVPVDLLPHFQGYSVWLQVAFRVMVGTLVGLAVYTAWSMQQLRVVQVDEAWRAAPLVRLGDFGTTKSLRITPLVNWHAKAGAGLRTEAGVAMLVKTDQHTVLFDLGWNAKGEDPSPLQHNMTTLGIDANSIDTVFISHPHHDHVGGERWEKTQTFSLGREQTALHASQAFATTPLSYPGLPVQVISGPTPLLPGVASAGPIPRVLMMGRVDEQALVIHVEDKGLVVVVGCGHQTLPKLLAHIERTFTTPIHAVVVDLHYPVPDGRRTFLGLNLQRLLASGEGITRPITQKDVDADLDLLAKRSLALVAMGGHDTSDAVLAQFAARLGPRFQRLEVGQSILIR